MRKKEWKKEISFSPSLREEKRGKELKKGGGK